MYTGTYVISYKNGNLYEKVQGIVSRVDMYHVRIFRHLHEGLYT